jgi:hypothetical protein
MLLRDRAPRREVAQRRRLTAQPAAELVVALTHVLPDRAERARLELPHLVAIDATPIVERSGARREVPPFTRHLRGARNGFDVEVQRVVEAATGRAVGAVLQRRRRCGRE